MSDILEHFGVKGMKWGVRKDAPKPALTTPKTTDAQTRLVKVGNKTLLETRKEKTVPPWKKASPQKDAAKIFTLDHKDKTLLEIRSNSKTLRTGKFFLHEYYNESGARWAKSIIKKYKNNHWVDGKLVLK